MQPWGFVRRVVNFPIPVRYSTEELSVLMGLGDDDTFNLEGYIPD